MRNGFIVKVEISLAQIVSEKNIKKLKTKILNYFFVFSPITIKYLKNVISDNVKLKLSIDLRFKDFILLVMCNETTKLNNFFN